MTEYIITLILLGLTISILAITFAVIGLDFPVMKETIILFIFIAMIITSLVTWLGVEAGGERQELGTAEEVIPIYALNDNQESTMHGSFFLGTGSYSTDITPVYVFVEESEYGLHVGKIKNENVYIQFISEDEEPCLIEHYITYSNQMNPEEEVSRELDYYEFRIPEGSIDYSYNIDLE